MGTKQVRPVEIVGHGKVKATWQPVYAATSASEPGRVHLIVWTPVGWECDCAAFKFRRGASCSHVRALSARLAEQLRRRDAEVAAAQFGPNDTFTLTDKGRAALAEWRKRKEEQAKRETSPRRGPASFSILK